MKVLRKSWEALFNLHPQSRSRAVLTVLGLAGLAFGGCVSGPKPMDAQARDALCRRAAGQFESTVLFKPDEATLTNGFAFQLAPLFLVEAKEADAAETMKRFPAVFFAESATSLNGQPRLQVSYCWPWEGTERRSDQSSPWQGVRITLGAAGQPVIWEVLHDGSGARLLFVSQNLEAAARREFGAPRPGRRFAVERALSEAPSIVVVRALDDAPVAMGPVIYLRGGTGDIGTVICRCMPSQAQRLVGQAQYTLRPAHPVGGDSERPPPNPSPPTPALPASDCWREWESPRGSLDQLLRLPAEF